MRPSILVIIAAVLAVTASAADPFYIGTWKIASATVAPWSDSERKPDVPESKMLVGQTVVIKTAEITGPRQLACKAPRYKLRDDPAVMLFQGAFEEMQLRDKSADPSKLAAKLGFVGSKWKTLDPACGNEIELHFVDPSTAEFGLNNFVYTMKKQ